MGYNLPDGVTDADIDRHFGDDEERCPHGEPLSWPCAECRDEGVADYDGEDRGDLDMGDEVSR